MFAILALFLYTSLARPSGTAYATYEAAGTLTNPVLFLSDDEALTQFNESYIFFFLYYAHAYELHNAPLSSVTPTLSIEVDDDSYTADIIDGMIRVRTGTSSHPDVTLTLSHLAVIRLLRDESALSEAFREGTATITLHASKPELFARGYVSLYSRLFDQSSPHSLLKIAIK